MAFTCSAEGTVDAAVFVCAPAAAAAISKKASDKHGNRFMALLQRTVIVLWAECLSGNCELCDPRGSHHCPASSIIAGLCPPDCASCAFFCAGARSRPMRRFEFPGPPQASAPRRFRSNLETTRPSDHLTRRRLRFVGGGTSLTLFVVRSLLALGTHPVRGKGRSPPACKRSSRAFFQP